MTALDQVTSRAVGPEAPLPETPVTLLSTAAALERLIGGEKTVFLDGAMGTQLAEAGVAMSGYANLTDPETVLGIHEGYGDCGVDLLLTNTLTMNRLSVQSHSTKMDVRAVNLAGAELAREAARDHQYVLGDMGSIGKLLKPYGPLSDEAAYAAFAEQAGFLAEGQVDGLMIETMFDLREAVCAVRAAREATDLPVIACVAFRTAANAGRTLLGNSARDCALALTEAGASAVGANCGTVTPIEMAAIVEIMRSATPLPIIAQPNAGKGLLVDGNLRYDMSPGDFATGAAACIQAGARLIGGCCGTSFAHIRAMVERLAGGC
ncbi:MAG: homocysteine S-methyltransferase family protein [Thermoleophilia bacterium]|nr:homocysteine S-methyltransferase family protein [Thermoleophilia bacterium]